MIERKKIRRKAKHALEEEAKKVGLREVMDVTTMAAHTDEGGAADIEARENSLEQMMDTVEFAF